MKFSEIFREEYYKRMLKHGHPPNPIRDQPTSFLTVFEELDKKEDKNFYIVETGCMRPDHGSKLW